MLTELQTVFIYALKDPRDGAVRYIGKARVPSVRLKEHVRKAKKSEVHSQRWILSLRSSGLVPILEVLDEVPETQWEFFERAYVKVYRELGADLTNLTDGGEGITNCSEETREKLRQANLGKTVYFSPEHRAKISAARKGHVHSEETKAKISATRKTRTYVNYMSGRTHTPESIAKMSASKAGTNVGSANPFFGRTHSEETLQKLRKPKSAEMREKLRQANLGSKHSPEHIEKCRLANLGSKRSEETKQKMRDAYKKWALEKKG